MRYERIQFDCFRFLNCHGRQGVCQIEALRASRGRVAVIATELRDNPGISITNAAEYVATAVCRRLETDPHRMIWIEHYGYASSVIPRMPRTFDRVTFATIQPPGNTLLFLRPYWRIMLPADWHELGLEPRLELVA